MRVHRREQGTGPYHGLQRPGYIGKEDTS